MNDGIVRFFKMRKNIFQSVYNYVVRGLTDKVVDVVSEYFRFVSDKSIEGNVRSVFKRSDVKFFASINARKLLHPLFRASSSVSYISANPSDKSQILRMNYITVYFEPRPYADVNLKGFFVGVIDNVGV